MKKKNKHRKSIYFKIISIYLTLFIVFSISLSFAGYFIPQKKIMQETFEDLKSETVEFHSAYLSSAESFIEFLGYELEGEGENNLVIRLSDKEKIVFENQPQKIPSERRLLKKEEDISIFTSKYKQENTNFIFIERTFEDDIHIIIGENFQKTQYIFDIIRNILIILNIISILLLAIILTITTKKILYPLKQLSEIVEKIPESDELLMNLDYSEYPEEIYRFAERFDTMLFRLKELMNETREISDNVAHDIRTPLTNIKMITEELLNESNDKNRKKILSLIDNLDRTTYIIDSIMSVAGILAQKKKSKLEEIDIVPILEDACELFSDISEEKNISIDFKDKHESKSVIGNIKSVQRIISNLLDNAIKYTPENGSIEITIEEIKDYTEVKIEDSGIGIPENDIKNIFKKFYKVDKSRGSSGIGLGLHTVKILLERIGGSISCKSTLGKGSTFILTFRRHLD